MTSGVVSRGLSPAPAKKVVSLLRPRFGKIEMFYTSRVSTRQLNTSPSVFRAIDVLEALSKHSIQIEFFERVGDLLFIWFLELT
jgi:hypothetical protein